MKAIIIDLSRVTVVTLLLSAFGLILLTGIASTKSGEHSSTNNSSLIALRYSTYLGANSADGVAVDPEGNIYITGGTSASSLITTPGAAQTSYGGGTSDAYVIKLNAAGDQIIYSTFIGGSEYDAAVGIAIDTSGNAYITGTTSSSDFPTSPGAFQHIGTGPVTVFVTKLNPTGSALEYSTYLGAGDARGIAIDSAGDAYVAGLAGENFPTTPDAFQKAGPGDAFVTRLNASGTALVYSTLLGGPEGEIAQAVAVDSSGNAYVVGGAGRGFPTTPGAFKTTKSGGKNSLNVFVAKLNPSGSALIYSTYLGGTGGENATGVAVDSAGNAYITGHTLSDDFPTTRGAFLRINRGFQGDAFVTKLDPTGSALVYSTLIGGHGSDNGRRIAIDNEGNAYIAGVTSSLDLPVINALQPTIADGPTYKSVNAGDDWSLINTGLITEPVRDLAVDPLTPSTLYAATIGGVFKSTDAGVSWAAVNKGLARLETSTIVVDPVTPATLYAATHGGIFKSTDGGDNWSASLAGGLANALAIDPTNHFVIYGGISSPDGSRVAKSTDGGLSWSLTLIRSTDFNSPLTAIAVDPTNPSSLYAAAPVRESTFDYLAKSIDGGRSWTSTRLALTRINSIAIDQRPPLTVYVGSEDGAYKSTDGGASWSEITGGLPVVLADLVIAPTNPSVLYASSTQALSEGVFKSTDGGNNWRETGLIGAMGGPLAVDPQNPANVYAATGVVLDAFVAKLSASGAALFYSTYLGGSSYDGVPGLSLAVDPAGSIYVAGITRSKDFPTANALRPIFGGRFTDSFVAKLDPPDVRAAPAIDRVLVSGKKLLVFGQNFSDGAVILLNDEPQKTASDETNPNGALVGKKAGKKIARGSRATIRVMNSDGVLSETFTFIRPFE